MPSVSKKLTTAPSGYSSRRGRLRPVYVRLDTTQRQKNSALMMNSTPNSSLTCSVIPAPCHDQGATVRGCDGRGDHPRCTRTVHGKVHSWTEPDRMSALS